MFTAERLAAEASDEGPISGEVLAVTRDAETVSFNLIPLSQAAEADTAALHIPLWSLWQAVMVRAAAIYASEAE
jgi:hypothetical protein